MNKVVTVVGARPQFIKAAVVSRELRKHYNEILVHTGQHYDHNMSDIFFEEMDIPKPDYNLGISGGSHGKMTGEMLIALEEVLQKEQPDCLLIYGDTNSTMAASLAAVKLHIPIVHVEAGNRVQTMDSPEEVNRIVADHVSTLLCCCTQSAMDFLSKEGIAHRASIVGDPMYDAFLYYSKELGEVAPEKLTSIDGDRVALPTEYYYLTCHRPENADNANHLINILSAMNSLDAPTIYPVHPRNKARIKKILETKAFENILFVEPVGYLMSIYLVNHCKKIVTDSGGLQREAFFGKKQCVSVLDYVVWPETMIENCNQLAKPNENDIVDKLQTKVDFDHVGIPFGDGQSAKKIVNLMIEKGF